MSEEARVLVSVPAHVWRDLQARCYARGIQDFRRCAGGFIQDALEGGFMPRTEEEEARYQEFLERHP